MDVSIMALIVLIGSQAVGKMTVGKELEKQIDGKLLFNHQTLDLFADFLGYSKDAFYSLIGPEKNCSKPSSIVQRQIRPKQSSSP